MEIKHNDVVIKRIDGELVVTSRQVAENFEKRHDHILRNIKTLMENDTTQNWGQYFIKDSYKDNSGKSNKEYLLTRDGFSLLVMGFTGSRALQWKLKYIEAFNKMENKLQEIKQLSPMELMELQFKVLKEHEEKIAQVENKVDKLEEDMPLFNIECKELQALVRRKGIETLCGKDSQAYKDNSLRGKVYADIQHQIKRELGVSRYEAIKRSQLNKAIEIVNEYKVPYVLEDEIAKVNNQIVFKEVIR